MSALGLDIGTTGCKGLVVNDGGDVIASSYREYPLLHPRPDWSELSPHTIWQAVGDIIKQVAHETAGDPITAIGLSVQGEAVTPVNALGEYLYNFSVSFDKRTIPQTEWWGKELGRKKLFEITGMPLHPMYTINKILWFRENLPEIYKATWKFLCMEDFVLFKLGVKPTIDYSLAARTMAFDVKKKRWSEELLNAADIDAKLLADVQPSGTAVGEVSPKVGTELGLGKGVMAVTGGHDQPCGALGAGIITEGLAMNAMGTSDTICPALDHLNLSDEMLNNNFPCYPHVKDGMFVTIAFNLTGGLLLRWYRDVLCQTEKAQARRAGRDVYDIIVESAAKRPADVLILPHFVGSGTPSLDPRSRGVVFGLTLETGKGDLTRGILDSLNYEMKLNMDLLENAGVKIEEIRAIGGGAKSAKWLKLRADVFGKPVISLRVSEAASLGAALLAGCATGVYTDIQDAVSTVVRTKEVYEPDLREHEKYRDKYEVFTKLHSTARVLVGSLIR